MANNSKKKITNKLVSSLMPKNSFYRIYDTAIHGFIVRVQPSGTKTFYYEYRNEASKNKSFKIGRFGDITADQAREIANDKSAEHSKGVDVQAEKVKQRKEAKEGIYKTLLSFIDNRYDEWAKTHLKRGGEAVKRMKYNFPHLLSVQLSEITKWDLDKWRIEQKKEDKNASTINRDITSLKAALSKAVEWGILTLNPLQTLKPLKLDNNASIRYLTVEEETQLKASLDDRERTLREKRARANSWRTERGYETLPELNERFADYLKPMVILSLYTGLRRGELFNLKWEDVNFASGFLTVQGATAKNQTTRHIPLHPEVKSILTKWQNGSTLTGYIFKNKDGERFNNTKRSWKKLLQDAGINNFRWHDLRHHFASKCVMDGLQLNSVRVLLGHSDIRMTLRYAHLNPTHLAEEINKLT